MTIELCMNSEFLASTICDDHDLDHGCWRDEIAQVYCETAARHLTDSGLDYQQARWQRITYHGWNGAHFDEKFGVFGVFGQLTDAEREIVEAAAQAGHDAAETYAEQAAERDAEQAELAD